ncbi:hypothetical protein LINPERPRIM_LOCUS30867 [Linum perenne]
MLAPGFRSIISSGKDSEREILSSFFFPQGRTWEQTFLDLEKYSSWEKSLC